jgi:hypothetical protein
VVGNAGGLNAAPQLLIGDVTLQDAKGDNKGGTPTIGGLLPKDHLSLRHQGSGAGQIGPSGSTASCAGVEIGTLTGAQGTPLQITFPADMSNAAAKAVLKTLTHANASNTHCSLDSPPLLTLIRMATWT